MKLVWTYNSNTSLKTGREYKELLINYYIHSIRSAKGLGYYTKIYTNKESISYFENEVDEIYEIESYEDSPMFDSFKFAVLEYEEGDYYLIDGDLILHSQLPELDYDVVFDSLEKQNWNVYHKAIIAVTNMSIKKDMDEWKRLNPPIPIFNCGLLRIRNLEFRKLYLDRWKLYNTYIKRNMSSIWNNEDDREWVEPGINNITAVGAQYLLTIVTLHHNISYSPIQPDLHMLGKYYKHHSGMLKYNKPLVPNKVFEDKIIKSLI